MLCSHLTNVSWFQILDLALIIMFYSAHIEVYIRSTCKLDFLLVLVFCFSCFSRLSRFLLKNANTADYNLILVESFDYSTLKQSLNQQCFKSVKKNISIELANLFTYLFICYLMIYFISKEHSSPHSCTCML